MSDKIEKLDIHIWQNHIDAKKKYIIEQIDNSHNLDKSSSNKKFIEILKNIINCKIFNVSQFAFLAIKLLVDSCFINSQIVLDILKDNDNEDNEDNEDNIENSQTNLNNILKIIIDFVIQIEISLNYHCILIIHFLNKVNKNELQPNVFNFFNKLDNDISESIKSSTIILLFLKFVRKLVCYTQTYNKTNTMLDTINSNSTQFNIKRLSLLSKNIKMYLDTFMININNYFYNNTNTNINTNTNTNNKNIYSICIDYIISIVEDLYNEFNYLFNILEACIIANYKINNIEFTEDKKKELENIKGEINILILIEINKCKELFKI